MRLSSHTAQANDNPLLPGDLHSETLIPIPAFILPVILFVVEVFRVDVGILRTDYLHVAFYLHIYRSEYLFLVGTERPFPASSLVPIPFVRTCPRNA